MDYSLILIDDPAPAVRRITLNRPEKRNALNATLRREILTATRELDRDPEVHVTVSRGAGKCVSAGYDLSGDPNAQGEPLDYNAEGEGSYMRGVTNGWMSIWDLAKPVIAQVHGYCLAGGSELATGCDLVYVADDAQIGYPAVRFGVPDMHSHAWLVAMRAAMEMMLTGDSVSGVEAVQLGWANRAYPAADLDERVVDETVDGEALIMDMVKGTYFSCVGASTAAWQALKLGASEDDVARGLAAAYGVDEARAVDDVRRFVKDLLADEVLVTADDDS